MGDILERRAMTIKLYRNLSEEIAVTKNITDEITYTGSLRSESSVIDPVILIEASNLSDYNYAWIEEFHRFYFIRDISSVRTNLWRLTMHVDVLSTYAGYIKENNAIMSRNSNVWNLYYQDDQFKILNYETIQTKAFGTSLNPSSQIVLIVAGG